jgi:glycosyltransferase involved in cell wall biosynthesis
MTGSDRAKPVPRVFGLMIVRNAADLIRVNVLHHLGIGLERLLVIDNGSSDGTRERLEALARELPVEFSVDSGPFRQEELTNGLAGEARRQGADWVLPIDADEFFVGPAPLPQLLRPSDAGALEIEVVNFVQRHNRRRPSERSLLTMDHRPAHTIPQAEARYHVGIGEWSLVEVACFPKLAIRAGERTWIRKGAHQVEHPVGPVEATAEIVCLHAPLRDRSKISARAEHGKRVDATDAPDGVGWQNRDIRAKDGELDRLWRANSNRRGWLDVGGERRALIRDRRLREVAAPHVPSRPSAALARLRGV